MSLRPQDTENGIAALQSRTMRHHSKRVTMWPSPFEEEQASLPAWPWYRNSKRWTSTFDYEARATRMSFYVGDTLLPRVPTQRDRWAGQGSRSGYQHSLRISMDRMVKPRYGDAEPTWEPNSDVSRHSIKGDEYGFVKSREVLSEKQIAKADAPGGLVPVDVLSYPFPGAGTVDEPYMISWVENDPANPLNFTKKRKWLNALILAKAVWTVSIASSGFSQGNKDIESEFGVSDTVALFVTSAFVLGFAVGALVLSPMSEILGRKTLYLSTYAIFVVLSGLIVIVDSIELLIAFRFLSGIAGSFTQACAPAVIADMFETSERGFVLAFFTLAGLLGQMLGPVFCGYLDHAFGWRSLAAFIALLSAPTSIAMLCTFPETFAPTLLRRRAAKMTAILGKPHTVDGLGEEKTVLAQLRIGALRPFLLLFFEPIVALLTLFLSVVQGTMFLLFAAYPIVFQDTRGWPQGMASLPFLAVALGIVLALIYSAVYDQGRYAKIVNKCNGKPSPEARLPPAMLGSVCLPLGLFWFAWTNAPSTFWLVSVSAGVFTGFGMVLLYMSLTNYIVDAYLGYAASALAATTVVRSAAAAAFPLFTTPMYDFLGIHWASSVPGFMSIIFAPALLCFYKWGHIIRSKTRFAMEAQRMADAISGGGK